MWQLNPDFEERRFTSLIDKFLFSFGPLLKWMWVCQESEIAFIEMQNPITNNNNNNKSKTIIMAGAEISMNYHVELWCSGETVGFE